MVPFIEYHVGSFIKGGIAIGTAYCTGKQCINFCKHFESKNIISVYKESAYNYNKAIENLLKISEDLKD